MMDQSYIDQNNVIERYAKGTLSDEELEQFEIYLMDHPSLLVDIEIAEQLPEALTDVLEAPGSEPVSAIPTAGWNQLSLAASLLCVVALASSVVLYQSNQDLREALADSNSVRAVSSQYFLTATRSNTAPQSFTVSQGTSLLSIEVPPEFAGPTLTVTITGQDSDFEWTSDDVFVDAAYQISVLLGSLSVGTYRIVVAASDATIDPISATFAVLEDIT
ncbi:MAG: hypothetical protein AAF004_07525 [Pseudomonadota bacterium]